jgi:hypothetical protein
MPPVQGPARMSHQDLLDAGHIRVADGRLNQEASRAAAAMLGSHEHIAQPGEGGAIRHEPGEAGLLALGGVEPEYQ